MRDHINFKYEFKEIKTTTIGYFLVLIAITIGIYIVKLIIPNETVQINGIEGLTAIFLGSYFLLKFPESFNFSQSFNLSRKAFIKSHLKIALVTSALATVVNLIIYLFIPMINEKVTTLEMIVSGWPIRELSIFPNLIWFIFISYLAIVMGTFFSVLLYRASKLKVALVIGVTTFTITTINKILSIFIKNFSFSVELVLIATLVLAVLFTLINGILIKRIKVEG